MLTTFGGFSYFASLVVWKALANPNPATLTSLPGTYRPRVCQDIFNTKANLTPLLSFTFWQRRGAGDFPKRTSTGPPPLTFPIRQLDLIKSEDSVTLSF